MEKKAEILKPYTKKQRLDFIVEENHQKGFEIRETDAALEAWGLTDSEIAEQEKQEEINRLKDELAETDYKIIKCSEYNLAGVALPYDIAELHARRQALRDRINELEG